MAKVVPEVSHLALNATIGKWEQIKWTKISTRQCRCSVFHYDSKQLETIARYLKISECLNNWHKMWHLQALKLGSQRQ